MGWFISTHLGHKVIHHGGNIDGYSAQIDRFVNDNLTVIVLANNEAHAAINIARVVDEMYVPNLDYDSIASLTQRGRFAYEEKKFSEAAELFLKALAEGDKTPATAFNAARCFSLLGRKDRALDYLERAAELGYSNVDLVKTDRSLLPLRDDARWLKIVEKVSSNSANQK